MPPELLSRIFARYSKPIAGHLLAYTRVKRYRKIRITSNKKLQALCDLIAMNADLGGLVQTLVIRLGNDGMATNGDMRALYQSLDKLESLEVSGRLVDLILSHDVASTCFPRLERLELDHPFQQHENSLEPARVSCIEHYRELTFLKVTICCYGSTTEGGIQVVSESAGELGRDDEGEGEVEEYQGGDEDESEVGSDGSRGRESMTQHVAGPSVGSTSKDSEDDSQGTILELHLTAPTVDIRTLDFVERFGSLVGLTLTDSAHYTSDVEEVGVYGHRQKRLGSLSTAQYWRRWS
jgi:hypothetical protein